MSTEQAVLFGLCMGLSDERIKPDLFAAYENGLAYKEILKLRETREIITPVELSAALEGRVSAERVSSIWDGQIGGKFLEINFRRAVQELIRARWNREIRRIAEKADDPLEAVRELVLQAGEEPEEVAAGVQDATAAASVGRFREFLAARRSGELWGWDLPSFPKLTRALMGLREIVVLAAKPKVGKSTLAGQISADVVDQGGGVVYLDMENGSMNLLSRDICRRTNTTFTELFSADSPVAVFIEGELARMNERRNFAVLQDRRITVDKLRLSIKEMQRMNGRPDVLVVVDSLQKLPLDLKERRASVDAWLRGFEQLMAELPGLAVILISELSRGAGQPKESGDIEYSGHFLLRLRAPKLEDAEAAALKGGTIIDRSDDGARDLWIENARDVPVPSGPIKLQADFEHWKFIESEW